MPATTATAPGKIILFGEHAVVYGRPAIAVPVEQVRARAVVSADPRAPQGRMRIQAPDIGLESDLTDLPEDHPLRRAVQGVLAELGVSSRHNRDQPPTCTLRVTSTIPIAAGLGSGAAVTVAVGRALSAFLGHPLSPEAVSALAYEVDKLHHGTPSGIDNTVIAYARPVLFTRGQPIQLLHLAGSFHIVIGDTGVLSPTAAAVGDLRRLWQADPGRYEALFDVVGEIVASARGELEVGRTEALGPLMDRNHAALQEMGVSSPELERLVEAARRAGALGAKLSGGGRGGDMIALVEETQADTVARALLASGAKGVITTVVREKQPDPLENRKHG
jgi:mevalonate kinase